MTRALRSAVALLILCSAIPALGYTPLAFLVSSGDAEQARFLYWQELRDGRPIRFAIANAGTPDIDLSPDDPAIDE